MCGIFGYLNYLVPATRREILEILIQGLKRLEYRGYDSAGVAFEGSECDDETCVIRMVKQKGKVAVLQEEIQNTNNMNFDKTYNIHIGIAHTRWATHGEPSALNSHPQRSDPDNEFVVVHNGIITNYKDIKSFLQSKGFEFESETDTEVIVKLVKHLYDIHKDKNISFRECVEMAIQQLEGAFAMALMSKKFPGECVATRRGSPLLLGVKSKTRLTIDHIPVLYSKDHRGYIAPHPREDSTTEFHPIGPRKEVEYFFASDASAVIEHTNQVIFLEDDDVAIIKDGGLSIYRVKRNIDDSTVREVIAILSWHT
ncbi:hypothetical protein ScPMuIL_004645 [Solemya velum]